MWSLHSIEFWCPCLTPHGWEPNESSFHIDPSGHKIILVFKFAKLLKVEICIGRTRLLQCRSVLKLENFDELVMNRLSFICSDQR